MKLVNIENYELKVTEEALLVAPIRRLFQKDKSKNKESFYNQMSILYFMVDPRSSYNYVTDENEKLQMILKQEGLPSNFKMSDDLKEAMEVYSKLVDTPSSMLFKASLVAVDKVRQFLTDLDLNLLDSKGRPVYTVDKVVNALKNVSSISKEIVAQQKIVEQEIQETGRTRGGEESKKLFENGFSKKHDSQ